MSTKEYIEWYKDFYGRKPGPNLIETFKKLNSEEQPDKKKDIDAICQEFDFLN